MLSSILSHNPNEDFKHKKKAMPFCQRESNATSLEQCFIHWMVIKLVKNLEVVKFMEIE